MTLLTIDEAKCKKDGLCEKECPFGLIKLKDGKGLAELVPGGEDICNSCGHCVAVCPHGALDHARVPKQKSPDFNKELEVNQEQVVQLLRSRRSIRAFKKEPVEQAKLQRLIEIARYAPTGGNRQLVEWVVLTDPAKIKDIAGKTAQWMKKVYEKAPEAVPSYFPLIVSAWDMGHDSVTWSAPALVLASAPKEAITGLVDVTLALSYFELAATRAGLGTCWAGLVNSAVQASRSVREAVGLPEGHPNHYTMLAGYPRVKYSRLPERKEPKITWK